MQRVIILFICLFAQCSYADLSPVMKEYQNDIASLIVKDITSKKVLYAKKTQTRLRPASLTKIMTALLAIESGKMNKAVRITAEATRTVPSKAGLKEGERIYLKDLVKSTLIQSANDSALAIGIYLGGNTRRFVAMMNNKARKLGMRNTRFVNPTGLDTGNHYSTAEDLLKLVEYAIKNKTFNTIVKLDQHVFSPLNRSKRYVARTSNRLLKDYKYAIGIKTGYTAKAGPCLIARAKKGNKDILLVMLNSRSRRWESASKILDGALGLNTLKIPREKQKTYEENRPSILIQFQERRFITPY